MRGGLKNPKLFRSLGLGVTQGTEPFEAATEETTAGVQVPKGERDCPSAERRLIRDSGCSCFQDTPAVPYLLRTTGERLGIVATLFKLRERTALTAAFNFHTFISEG